MFGKVTPEKAIVFIKRSVALTFCWPLSSTATKFQLLRFKMLRVIMVLSAILLYVPLLYASYLHRDNAIESTKALCSSFAVAQIIMQTSYCMTQYDRLQVRSLATVCMVGGISDDVTLWSISNRSGTEARAERSRMVELFAWNVLNDESNLRNRKLEWLIGQMVAYCQTAKSHERYIVQQYIDKYSTFYGIFTMWFYTSAILVVVGTLFISQPFPTNAEYPFPTDYEPVRTIVFLHQSLACVQCAAQVSINMVGASLLLFAAVRFEILAAELRAVDSIHGLVQCVKRYYDIRRYAQEVVSVVQYMSLMAITFSTLSVIFFGIFLIGRQPLMVKLPFSFLVGTALLEVFMCAWPADNLMQISENAMAAAYESTWYTQSLELQKNVLYLLLPQKPVTINFKCVVPVLSLSYYTSFVSNTFSMFTALRVMISDEDEN